MEVYGCIYLMNKGKKFIPSKVCSIKNDKNCVFNSFPKTVYILENDIIK